jgi:hypothetical protein
MSSKPRRLSIEELRSIVAPVAEKHNVDRVYLFGSVARGDHNENSDYDFCVECPKIRGIFAFSGFFQELRTAVGNEIDLVDMDAIRPEFLNKIKAEGVVLFEQ